MTLRENYNHLTESFTFFGKTYAPRIQAPLTVEKLQAYADEMYSKKMPAFTGIADEMRKNLSYSGNSLDGNI